MPQSCSESTICLIIYRFCRIDNRVFFPVLGNQRRYFYNKKYNSYLSKQFYSLTENLRRHMKKRLSTVLIVMLIAALTTSTVWAGGLKLSGSFTSGSLHFDGSLIVAGGSFPKGLTLELIGIGIPEV